MMFLVVAALLPFAQRSAAVSVPNEVQLLVRANQSAVDRVQTISARYRRLQFVPTKNRAPSARVVGYMEWWRDADRQRIRYYYESPGTDAGPKREHTLDFLFTQERTLECGYDFVEKPALRMFDDKNPVGVIRPPERFVRGVDPMRDVLFHVHAEPGKASWSLANAVKAATKLTFSRDGGENARPQIDLTLSAGREWRLIVELDPLAQYLVRKVRVSVPASTTMPTVDWAVVRFAEAKPGVMFPVEIASRSWDSGGNTTSESTIEFDDLKVNDVIHPGAFELRFPENITVIDTINSVRHVWGKDGPKHTFRTVPEEMAFRGCAQRYWQSYRASWADQ